MSRVRLPLSLALVLLLPPLSGCEKAGGSSEVPSEDSVDQRTRELLVALSDDDPARARGLSNSSLAAELDERTVALLARTLSWLGPVTSLAHDPDSPVRDGVERHYQVGFERGEIALTVTIVGAKIEGFEFDPGQWEAFGERAGQARAGSLRIAEFAFVSADGAPLPGPDDPSEIRYSLALEGLDAQLREHHVTVGKQVFDGAGAQVYRQPSDDDVRFPQAETGSDGGTITGAVAVPGPGRYELELRITDLVGGKTLIHRVEIAID